MRTARPRERAATISEDGLSIVKAAASSDAVLVDWAFEQAPALNTLC